MLSLCDKGLRGMHESIKAVIATTISSLYRQCGHGNTPIRLTTETKALPLRYLIQCFQFVTFCKSAKVDSMETDSDLVLTHGCVV